jgi:hypothetical protein
LRLRQKVQKMPRRKRMIFKFADASLLGAQHAAPL